MEIIFTPHADFEMKRRNLSEEMVRWVIENSEQKWEVRKGRIICQSRVKMEVPEREFLIRVFVDIDSEPAEVVTAYRTSKIEKYWRDKS